MNHDNLIEVRNLSKSYKIFDKPQDRLKQKFLKNKTYYRDFWALNDISFEVKRGESFGIVGRNGSGKSTLLQILAGIFPQTSGTVEVNGKISALLELGSGFNPEFTGRENVYINASVLGLKEDEINERMESIIEFADIGDFIDQPVKTYSSGMFVRLAFAVSTSVDAQILLVDEALAVGDIFFRQKCYDRLNKLRSNGTAIILVSHAMNEVEQFCERALFLNSGKQEMLGRSPDVVKQYYLMDQENAQEILPKSISVLDFKGEIFDGFEIKEEIFFDLNMSKEISNGKAKFIRIGLFDKLGYATRVFEQGEDAYFFLKLKCWRIFKCR